MWKRNWRPGSHQNRPVSLNRGSAPQNGIKFPFLFFQFVILIFSKLICFLLSGKYHNHNHNLQNKGQSRIKTKAEAEDKLDIGR